MNTKARPLFNRTAAKFMFGLFLIILGSLGFLVFALHSEEQAAAEQSTITCDPSTQDC